MVKTRGFVEVETVGGVEVAEDEAVEIGDEVAVEVAKAMVLEAGVEVAPAIAIVEVGAGGSLEGGGTATDEDAGAFACLVGRVEVASRAAENVSATADAVSANVEVGVEVGTRGSKADAIGSKKRSGNGASSIAGRDDD